MSNLLLKSVAAFVTAIRIGKALAINTKNNDRNVDSGASLFKEASNSDIYGHLRNHIVHEDGLINNRLNWLILSQTFLFAAYGASLTYWSQPNTVSS